MPSVQANYNTTLTALTAGQIVNSMTYDAVSRVCEGASGIGFGIPVIIGTAENQAKIGGAGVFVGITVRDPTLPASRADKYAAGDSMAVMTRGSVAVLAGEAVAQGDAVYRTAAGVLNKTASGNTLIANAVWDTSAANGALAVIRLG